MSYRAVHAPVGVVLVVSVLAVASCKKAPEVSWEQATPWTQELQDAFSLVPADTAVRSLSDSIYLHDSGKCPEFVAAKALPSGTDFESRDRAQAMEKAAKSCRERIRGSAGQLPKTARVRVGLWGVDHAQYDFTKKGYLVKASDIDLSPEKGKASPGSALLEMVRTIPGGGLDTKVHTYIEFRDAASRWSDGALFFPVDEQTARSLEPRLTKKIEINMRRQEALELLFVPGPSFVTTLGFSVVPAQLLAARVVEDGSPLFPSIAFPQP